MPTGERSCFFRSFSVARLRRRAVSEKLDSGGRRKFHELASERLVVPVWRELMADTITPVGAFSQVVGDEPGFLLESVEGGDRWGRYSFVGRRPLMSIVSRGLNVELDGGLPLPDSVTGAAPPGCPRTPWRSCSTRSAPRSSRDLPPLHSGFVGYLGYDVVREIERLPDVAHDDLGLPDASMFLIGQLCAFDHWRQRVVLVENVPVAPGLEHRGARCGIRRRFWTARRAGIGPVQADVAAGSCGAGQARGMAAT